jgi:hypothetical protein
MEMVELQTPLCWNKHTKQAADDIKQRLQRDKENYIHVMSVNCGTSFWNFKLYKYHIFVMNPCTSNTFLNCAGNSRILQDSASNTVIPYCQ